MEWISGALVVAVIILLFLLVRKRQREQADGDVEHSAKLSESTSTSKQSQQESASTTMPERNKPYLSADEREAVARRKFIEKMKPFLELYGTENTNVLGLLDYVKCKTHLGFKYHGVEWFASRNGIRCHHEFGGHSFFDDGGGEEGQEEWSFFAVESEVDCVFQNDKLNDLVRYPQPHNGQFTDLFFCENPFGLKGVFKVSYSWKHELTD